MKWSTRTLAGLLVVAAASAVPLAAQASSPRGRIIDVASSSGQLRVVFTATGLANNASIDPASVKLSVDGTSLAAHAATVGSQTAAIDRSAMLVIDTSGSMAGEGLTGAKAAASAFLAAVPSDVRVGLVTFSDKAQVNVPISSDRTSLRNAISKLHASGETALYDAVGLALRTLGNSGVRTIVLLTDGADTRSHTSLGALLSRISSSKVTIDAVGFRTNDAQSAPLRSIATKAGGQVVAAQATTALASAFKSAAQDISHQIVVTAPIPKSVASKSGTITVTATAGAATLSDSVFAPIGSAAVSQQHPQSFGPRPAALHKGLPKAALWGALAAVFLGVAILLTVAISSITRNERTGVRRRLSIYTLKDRPVEESREETSAVLGDSAVARSAVELAGRVVSSRDLESVLARKLDAAGVPMKPAEWLILHVGIAVVAGLLMLLISGGGLLATLIGVGIGLAAPWGYLALKESSRTNAFLDRLPDTLQLMAGGLRAGYSLPQSVDAAVREGSEPIASEFNRALVETRLGVSIEDALEGVGKRMRSMDFEWVVMAIRIQREVGGNLAEVLSTVASTLRERARLRRQVRVLSAEGRLSAWILGGLPPVFFLYLLLVRHSYIQTLWHDPIGIVMIVFLFVDLVVGILWLRKVIQVEV